MLSAKTGHENQTKGGRVNVFPSGSAAPAGTRRSPIHRIALETWKVGTRDPPQAPQPGRASGRAGGGHRARTSRAPPTRLERQRRTAGRRISGLASLLVHRWASEPACASLASGGPRREGEWGRTPEGGGRRGPGSARRRGRAEWCPELATGLATHSQAHTAPSSPE